MQMKDICPQVDLVYSSLFSSCFICTFFVFVLSAQLAAETYFKFTYVFVCNMYRKRANGWR